MTRKLPALVVAVLLAALPWVLPSHLLYLVTLIASTSVIVSGLTVVTGFAGQISLAQSAFSAIGGYGMVLLFMSTGLPYWLGLPLVVMVTAAVGYFFGALALRIEDHYLALATMAVSAIVQLLLIHLEELTGGAVGLAVPPLRIGGTSFVGPAALYAIVVPIAAASMWTLWAVSKSRLGRAFTAMRMSEIAVASSGISVLRMKSLAFALSAGFGALGGGLLALQTTYLDPAQFGIIESVRLIAIAVVGGLRSPLGPVIGSAVFVLLPEVLGKFGSYMALVFSLVLLGFMLISPLGVAGLLDLSTRRKLSRGGR